LSCGDFNSTPDVEEEHSSNSSQSTNASPLVSPYQASRTISTMSTDSAGLSSAKNLSSQANLEQILQARIGPIKWHASQARKSDAKAQVAAHILARLEKYFCCKLTSKSNLPHHNQNLSTPSFYPQNLSMRVNRGYANGNVPIIVPQPDGMDFYPPQHVNPASQQLNWTQPIPQLHSSHVHRQPYVNSYQQQSAHYRMGNRPMTQPVHSSSLTHARYNSPVFRSMSSDHAGVALMNNYSSNFDQQPKAHIQAVSNSLFQSANRPYEMHQPKSHLYSQHQPTYYSPHSSRFQGSNRRTTSNYSTSSTSSHNSVDSAYEYNFQPRISNQQSMNGDHWTGNQSMQSMAGQYQQSVTAQYQHQYQPVDVSRTRSDAIYFNKSPAILNKERMPYGQFVNEKPSLPISSNQGSSYYNMNQPYGQSQMKSRYTQSSYYVN